MRAPHPTPRGSCRSGPGNLGRAFRVQRSSLRAAGCWGALWRCSAWQGQDSDPAEFWTRGPTQRGIPGAGAKRTTAETPGELTSLRFFTCNSSFQPPNEIQCGRPSAIPPSQRTGKISPPREPGSSKVCGLRSACSPPGLFL